MVAPRWLSMKKPALCTAQKTMPARKPIIRPSTASLSRSRASRPPPTARESAAESVMSSVRWLTMTGCRGRYRASTSSRRIGPSPPRSRKRRHGDQGEEARHAQQQGREMSVDPEFLQKLRKNPCLSCSMRVLGAVQPAVSIRACRSEQVETVEDVLAVLQYLPPLSHLPMRKRVSPASSLTPNARVCSCSWVMAWMRLSTMPTTEATMMGGRKGS